MMMMVVVMMMMIMSPDVDHFSLNPKVGVSSSSSSTSSSSSVRSNTQAKDKLLLFPDHQPNELAHAIHVNEHRSILSLAFFPLLLSNAYGG